MQLSFIKLYKWGVVIRLMNTKYLFFVFELGFGAFSITYSKGWRFIFCWPQRVPEGMVKFRGLYWTKATSSGINSAITKSNE